MVRKRKPGVYFGITSPVTGRREYVGPFKGVYEAKAEMKRRFGKNKRIVRKWM